MKNFIVALSLLFTSNLSFSQTSMEVNVAGINPNTEKKMLAGDQISYWEAANGDGHQNIRVRVSGANGKDQFFSSLDVAPDANGHYTFSHKIECTDGTKFSFDEAELELLVYVETIFGNVLWTKVKRNKSNFSDPIILDKYTFKQNKSTPAMRRMIVNFYYKGNKNGIEEKVKELGDSWDNVKISDFRFRLKNEGDADWKVDKTFESGQNLKRRYVRVNIPFEGNCPIDLKKKVVMRAEVKTDLGNTVWHETTMNAREMRTLFWAQEVTKKEEGADDNTTDDGTDNSTTTSNPTTTTSTNPTTTTTTSPTTTTTTTTTSKPGSTMTGGATDLTTQTTLASCSDMVKGDTLISMNGSKVCVRAMKPDGSKAMTGRLAMDCNFRISGTIFPIKGDETIKCNKADGKLTQGVLRANITYSSTAGDVVLKEGTIVKFRGGKFIAGTLAENPKLSFNGKTYDCAMNSVVDHDIKFDVQGKLIECSLAADTPLEATATLTLPKMSRMIFKSGQLNRVICPTESSFDLNGTKINVSGNNTKPAYNFANNGRLSEVNSGKGNSVLIEEQVVGVKEGTKIKFELNGESLQIEKFFVANQVILNVQKGSKLKAVTVKPGKKVVLKEGKVVKAG